MNDSDMADASQVDRLLISTVKEKFDPRTLLLNGHHFEVGSKAIWSVSSCKQNLGVRHLRDGSLDTYWQSDGPQPHWVDIQFMQKTAVSYLCFYVDFKADESYTPSRISVRAGTHYHDLSEVASHQLREPAGWVLINLQPDEGRPLHTFLLQLAVLANHQNGRDTHIRQVVVLSPRVEDGEWLQGTLR